MRFGAVADDVTGGTDLASVLRRNAADVVQVLGVPTTRLPAADAVVVSLKTRTSPAAEAVRQSSKAFKALRASGAEQIYFKYCSTFDSTDDGNIGPVLDALLDESRIGFTIACPAYPSMRRTVYAGNLFVGEQLLSDSPMRHHPLTPMTDANLVRVLDRQSRSSIGLVPLDVVEEGVSAVRAAFSRLAADGHRIAIVDALFERHIRTLSYAAVDLKLASGGAALGGALGERRTPMSFRADGADVPEAACPGGPVAILSGSCSAATLAQIARLGDRVPAKIIDPVAIADRPGVVDELADWCRKMAKKRSDVLVFSTATSDALEEVRERLGRSNAAEVVESAFRVAASALADAGVRTFVVAGGETSGAVMQALGVQALRFGQEIEPGVPWTTSIEPAGFRLALKSGNFGSPNFFAKALGEAREGR